MHALDPVGCELLQIHCLVSRSAELIKIIRLEVDSSAECRNSSCKLELIIISEHVLDRIVKVVRDTSCCWVIKRLPVSSLSLVEQVDLSPSFLDVNIDKLCSCTCDIELGQAHDTAPQDVFFGVLVLASQILTVSLTQIQQGSVVSSDVNKVAAVGARLLGNCIRHSIVWLVVV